MNHVYQYTLRKKEFLKGSSALKVFTDFEFYMEPSLKRNCCRILD